MLTVAVILLVGGLVVGVAGFFVCIFSMLGKDLGFRRFVVGMAVMAVGGIAFVIGFYLGGFALLRQLIPGL